MSRIGKMPVDLPKGVEVKVEVPLVKVKGPKGELQFGFVDGNLEVAVDAGKVSVSPKKTDKHTRALHGLTRSLIANAVIGVTEGFSKKLDVYGVGYRVDAKGQKLTMQLGFSHPVEYEVPEGIVVSTENPVQGAQARIVVSGIDKQQVGQVAAEIRTKRKPEPYKGKGVRYENEVINWKQGKSAAG
jgi:large subunit ribosomal protein L6